MPEPLAYWNGQFVPAGEICVSLEDTGFVQGVTVAERLRTFGGKLFRLPQHLARLRHSLAIIGLAPMVDCRQLGDAAEELVHHNHQLLTAGDDLSLVLFVTPGDPTNRNPPTPTVCLHTRPLPFPQWSHLYEQGQSLIVSSVRQVPATCWPPELKCRSRMHYYLADREAARRQPGARAVLLDQDGFVSEASTANLVVYLRDQGLVSPPLAKILPGVSIGVLAELAPQLGIPFGYRDLTVAELHAADEVLLSSTSPCVWSVVAIDGRPVGTGRPGEVAQELLAAWSRLVDLDIAAQARQFATSRGR